MSETTKVIVNLPTDLVKVLERLATANNMTMTETLSRSIQLNKYLTDQEGKNAKILVETADGKFKRLVRS